jgi:hypothetical protein
MKMDKAPPIEFKISSLANYMEFVETAQRDIRENNSDDLLLFRGQSVDAPLLPKMARHHVVLRQYDISRRHSLLETESRMMSEFNRRAHPFLNVVPATELDWLSLAQHHGMETRLLDWSSNALVGLYFALEEDRHQAERVVWVLRCSPEDIVTPEPSLDPSSLRGTKVYRPSLLSPRIIAQDGWFSVHKYSKRSDSFVALERKRVFKTRLTKLRITGKQIFLCRNSIFAGLTEHPSSPDWTDSPNT